MTTNDESRRTTTPCPDWCELPAGHGYTEVPGAAGAGTYGRSHSCSFGGFDGLGTQINAWAAALSDGAPEHVTIGGIFVGIDETVLGPLTATQARKLAADLEAASRKHDEITGQAA
jgi:hypothetical protein